MAVTDMQPQSYKQKGPADVAEPWVSIEPACRHLGISIPTMRRWIRDEYVKPKRTPNGHYRFRLSDLDALLA
jgi:excisionase family DNA binding protein